MAAIDPNESCPCGSGQLFKNCHALKIKVRTTPPITKHMRLKVIPEPDPDTRTVFNFVGEGTIIFKGFDVGLALDCGTCEAPLVEGISRDAISNVVICCNRCGSFNEL